LHFFPKERTADVHQFANQWAQGVRARHPLAVLWPSLSAPVSTNLGL
jgi:hypothetical protein